MTRPTRRNKIRRNGVFKKRRNPKTKAKAKHIPNNHYSLCPPFTVHQHIVN
jgi:hypothetical protein